MKIKKEISVVDRTAMALTPLERDPSQQMTVKSNSSGNVGDNRRQEYKSR